LANRSKEKALALSLVPLTVRTGEDDVALVVIRLAFLQDLSTFLSKRLMVSLVLVAIMLYDGFIDDGNEGGAVFLCCMLSSNDGKKF
jgi:hypothetical protein